MSRPWSFLSSFSKSRSEQPRGRKARRKATPRPTAPAQPSHRAIPLLEALEDRFLPSTVTWINSGAGDWANGSNWDVGHAPSTGDDVVALIGNPQHSTGTDTFRSLTGANIYLSGGSITITNSLLLKNNQTLTIGTSGTLNVGSAAVTVDDNNGTIENISVFGTLTAAGASFTRSGGNGSGTCQVLVNAGGHLSASNSTFNWDQFTLADGSVLNSGDLTGNIFATTLSVPATDVPLLTNNKSFQDVDINAGSLSSGQNVALNPMGTSTPVGLQYVFPGAFEVKSGATISWGDGASILIRNGQTVTVDSGGTLNVGAATVAIEDFQSNVAEGIAVSGVLSATGASFIRSNGNLNQNDNSEVLVNAGGKLTASNSTFAWDNVVLVNGSVALASGDVTGNIFGTTLSVPVTDVPLLTNNKSFGDVFINAGSLAGGQSVALNPMGTATTVGLQYDFVGFEVKSGATLSVGDGATALIRNTAGVTVDSGGTLNIGAATVAIEDFQSNVTEGIAVSGVLSATGASFIRSNGNLNQNDNSEVLVNAGGKLTASNSTFAWDNVVLVNGSVALASGDVTGNIFGTTLSVPVTDVPLLTNNKSFGDVFINAGSLAGGQSVALNPMGTSTPVGLQYDFTGSFEVKAGATLSIGDGATALIRNTAGVTVDSGGTLNIGAATVAIEDFQSNVAEGIAVSGVLSATGASFIRSNGNLNQNDNSEVLVNAGGKLTASNSTFAWDNVVLVNGSVALASGDVTGNIFGTELSVPVTDVPLLTNNKSFQDVFINAGSLAGGQSVALNPMGTSTPVGLQYDFSGAFEVKSGATLSIGDGATALIRNTTTVTVDSGGTLSIGAATVAIEDFQSNVSEGIAVNGTLSATGASFIRSNGNLNQNDTSWVLVNAGGKLTASNSTFAWDNVVLVNGSVALATGDVTGNIFSTTLSVPVTDVPLLTNNKSFQDVYINAGSLAGGQSVALNPMGTSTPVGLQYDFTGSFEVKAGATLSIGDGATALIRNTAGVTVDSGGTLNIGAATVAIEDFQSNVTEGIAVSGVLSATGASFIRSNGNLNQNDNSEVLVNAGGKLTASNSTFAWDNVVLVNGSVALATGDVTGNIFGTTLSVPVTDVPLLTNNKSFQDVFINAGSLTSGQNVALNLMGTATPVGLQYDFTGGFEVKAGATLSIGDGATALIRNTATVTVDSGGTLNVGAATVAIEDFQSNVVEGVVVNGVLSATGASFIRSNGNLNQNDNSQLLVNTTGHLTATGSSFAWDTLTLSSGSTDTLQFVSFATQLAITSGASISISSDDFSSASATVVASGDANATIDLRNNYWGTTTASQIAAKITDHVKNSALPTVLYQPFLGGVAGQPGSLAGLVFNDLNGNGAQDGGEPGLPGVVVYLDTNNNGVFDAGEPSTVTQNDDPSTPGVNEAGLYSFGNLAAGTYVVRAAAPAGSVETVPSAAAVATTINFDGTGAEAGITGAGVSTFTFQGATFSGGTIFAPSTSALLASGTLAYNASSGSAAVDFSRPIGSVSFFYVHGSGFAAGTATAFGADGSTLGSVGSKADTTNGDPNNFVTLGGFAQPIARLTFSGAVIDKFTFTTAANNQAYFVRLQAGQAARGLTFGSHSAPGTFIANSVAPTTTGFTATFNQPLNVNVLSLIDTSAGTFGPADATLVGQNVGAVTGSLVVSPDAMTVTFIKTAGLLAPDTYTLTLRSAANGFVSTTGNLLDGNGDGTPGDNLTSTFTVSTPASNAVVVSIPNFARGYGQPVNIPASGSAGLPILLSTGLNVSGVDLTLHYNPALLTLSGFTTTIAGASAVFNVPTPGTAVISVSTATQLSATAGPITLGSFTAAVPNNAPYGLKEVLDITNLSVFDSSPALLPLPAIPQDAIHVAAYFGDLNGDQQYSAQDVTLEQRIIGLLNSGFPAYQVADPVLLGDITLNGRIQANDTTSIQREVGLVNVPNIPALPSGLTAPPNGGPDPEIFIPNVRGNPGDTVTVPVRLAVTEAAGITVSGFQVAIAYDPNTFTVGTSAQLGSMFSASLGFSGFLSFPAPGQIIFSASSATGTGTIPFNTTTDLFTLSFKVASGATNGTTSAINLLHNIQGTTTAIFANDADLTEMTLSPAPTNNPTDPVDSTFFVGTAPTTTATGNVSVPYSAAAQNVNLSATVTSPLGTVNVGTVAFTILKGTLVIGTPPAAVNVAGGAASVTYTLPASTAPDTYTISAAYSDNTGNFAASTDTSHTLTVNSATAATVAITLDPNSNSGAPDHPGYTNVTKPTFDVQVNQAGTITVDFDGNTAHDQTQSVSTAGTYLFTAPTLSDGAYTATATFDAALAGKPHSVTGYVIDTVPPSVTSLSPTGTVYNGVSQVTVKFTEPVDLGTFIPSAVTLTGPGGTVTVLQPQLVANTTSTYSIGFAAQTVPGKYTLTVAASVTDFAANPLGQPFSGSFTIALPDLAVTATTAPSTAAEGSAVPLSWTVTDLSPTTPATSTWMDSVYLSTHATLDNTAQWLISVAAPPQSPLAGGANYTRNVSITLPGNIATGSYYLLFLANADGGQLESDTGNDGNDLVADPVTLTAADLQVTGVSGPISGFNSQDVLVSWTDRNSGTGPAAGPWVDNVYATTDAQGHNPTLLGSFTFSGTLAVGASAQRTQQVALPKTAGTYWLAVTTNATQTVPEGTNFNNNTTVAASSTLVNPTPLPDLQVESITPPLNGVLSGTSVPVSFVVKNHGTAPSAVPVWHDWVILSQDATLGQTYQGQLNGTGPGGDQLLNNQPVIAGFVNPSYLGVGESYQQNVNVTLPISAQGTWYVYVVPDGTGAHHPFAMPELSRTDKLALSAGFSVTLSPPPDLAVSGVTAPDQDFSGKPMNVSWTVTNSGTGPTAANAWTDAIYMSSKSTLDASATLLGTLAHQGVLAVGGSYPGSQTVTLPVGVSGSFYFLVKTDLNGQVFENGATANNVAATATAKTVNLTPPPDLTVSSISPPATAVAGHTFAFSYTVTNAGAGDTPNYTWDDAPYLSPTMTFDPKTAISLGTQTHQGILVAGAHYTNAVTATVPNGLAGSYYLFVNTDSGNVVFEVPSTKGNNLGGPAGSIQITSAPPDLVVSAASAPPAALPGSAILVHWTVTNNSTGDTAVSSWQDSVYVDTGTTLSGNAVLLGSFAHYGLLAGGGSYSQTQLLTLPINLLGNYNLFVVANSSGTVYESSTSNNTSAAVPVAISLQLPAGGGGGGTLQADVSDLQVTSVTGTAVTGSVTVSWTVQNKGTGATNANYWNDDVWLSTKSTLGSGGTDVYLGTVQRTNPLAAGASYSASGTYSLPSTLAAGSYYYLVATDRPVVPPNDPDSEGVKLVYESNATNNVTASSAAAAVAPAPLPDLTVSNVTVPTTATSGGQLALSWKVTNNGAATGTVPITDSVYLSFDQVFDPTTDRYLGSVTYQGGLASGANYTQNATIALPAGVAGTFYVIVDTNTNNDLAEQDTTNNTAYGAQPVQIQLSPQADLVAGTVTVPATATAGQNITVTYQVTNNGGNPANGTWYDALYLSPTPVWNVSDPLLGTVSQTQNLAHGDSYTGTLTAPLPGVAPGPYYVIVRANILATLPEQSLSNNLSASLTTTAIDAPALTLGTATNGTLGQGQAAYYKVVVSAGQTLQVGLTGQNAAAHNELYVSFGTMPTRSQYDFRYGQPFAASQQVTVPTTMTQVGAYYILVYGDSVPSAPESYAITAAVVPFLVQAVTPGQAGAGPVTLRISGARFDFATTFQLKANGKVINATRTLLQDSATAFATFDLTGQALGAYDVWAVQSDGTSTALPGGLNVVAATPNNSVRLGLIVPQVVLVGRPGTVTVNYDNPGNTDLPAPLLLLGGQNALLQAPGQASYAHAMLQLYGFNPAGPFGTLPPGFQGSITLSFKPVTAGAGIPSTFTLQTLQDPNQPFDWSAVAANDVPVNTSATQWSLLVSQAAALLGGTWGAVVASLGIDSVQLVKNEGARTAPAALNSLYNFAGLLQYVVGSYGAAAPAATTPPFPKVASEGEVTVYNAHVDGSGNALPLNPSYPTFVITHGLNGYRDDFGALATAIATDTNCFPNGHVNVLIATWQGATAGPSIGGIYLPWIAALHIDTAGAELGDLLNALRAQGSIDLGTTTAVGESFGNYVNNAAAGQVGGLGGAIALNPATWLGGYLPPDLRRYFQHSIAYETSSLFDTQWNLAESNQTLDTGDLNNPIGQHTFGVTWLTGQVLAGNCSVLNPGPPAGPDVLPPGNDPALPSDPTGLADGSGEVVQIISHDPNSIIGPKGSGTFALVATSDPLPYSILFTNLATAQASAQQVIVKQQLSSNLAWGSFRLGNFGFRGQTYSVPANSAYYQTTIDLARQFGFDVAVTATIDESTGVATWTFTTLDPATGEVPLDPTLGFLPPDDASGDGEGFVSYTIQAASTDATGTVITAQATVIFDTQPPLDTPVISNTVDAGTGLAGTVAALPAFEPAQFNVSWSGSDAANGSAVRYFTVYVSDNGGPSTAWLKNTALTSAPFVGVDGHTYAFASVASDNAGNVQPVPATSQATTTVDAVAPTSTVAALPSISPASFTVSWSGSDNAGGSGVASFSIFVSRDGGPFAAWLTNTTQTSAVYAGVDGHSYGFYSVATDKVGNVQPTPASAQASTVVVGVTRAVVNGDLAALAGAQRSMVRDLVYTFNHAVTLAAGAFTIALHANVTVNGVSGQTVGVLPALSYSTADGGVTWVVTFSGAGVVNGSIADGVYDITLHASAVTDELGQALSADRVDTFYRLFGDADGNRKVNNADLAAFSAAFNKRSNQAGYLAYLDYDGSGRIDNGDLAQFANRFNTSFGGF